MLLLSKFNTSLTIITLILALTACSDSGSSDNSSSTSGSTKSAGKEIRLLNVKREAFNKITLVEYNAEELEKLMVLIKDLNTVEYANKKFDAEGFNAVRTALSKINADPAKDPAFLEALAALELASVEAEQRWNESREGTITKIEKAKKDGSTDLVKHYQSFINDPAGKKHYKFRDQIIRSEMNAVSSAGNKAFQDARIAFREMAGSASTVELRVPFSLRHGTKAFVLFGDNGTENYRSYNLPVFMNKISLKGIPAYLIDIAASKNGLEKEEITQSKYLNIFIDEFDRNGAENWIRNFLREHKKSTQ